jgi:oligosaccharide reducing-end xylanase
MKAHKWFCVVWLTFSFNLCGVEIAQRADGNGAYKTGRYRNVFAEAAYSQTEIRQKLDAAFQQLFHGNLTNEAVYYQAGSNSNGLLARYLRPPLPWAIWRIRSVS